MAMKTKSALSYFGSDSEVAASLAAMLDGCNHVTIPFVGGAAILPHLKARSIICNDLHDAAINFYRVLSGREGDREKLIYLCTHAISHPSELAEAGIIMKSPLSHDSTLKAWAFWATCWIGRKGKGGTKYMVGMPSVRRTASGGSNASRLKAAAADLNEWAAHFQRCEWECKCFRELLPKVADNERCGVYCDPPWVDLGRDYLHSFTEEDHIDLRDMLSRFEHTKVVVRYGDHPLVRDLYAGWHIEAAESRTQTNKVKGEIWIANDLSVST